MSDPGVRPRSGAYKRGEGRGTRPGPDLRTEDSPLFLRPVSDLNRGGTKP